MGLPAQKHCTHTRLWTRLHESHQSQLTELCRVLLESHLDGAVIGHQAVQQLLLTQHHVGVRTEVKDDTGDETLYLCQLYLI